MTVKTRIIKIGNSQGVRIPKPLLEQSGLGAEVELEVEQDRIVIHNVHQARQGWSEAFAKMAEYGDDALLDGEIQTTEWDETEWQWQ